MVRWRFAAVALESPQSDATVFARRSGRPQGPSCRRKSGGCRMRKLIFASVIALAAALKPAGAADTDLLYGPPPVVYAPAPAVVIFTWTGFYFGAHGGGGWSHKTETGTGFNYFGDILTPTQFRVDASGWLAGGQIGAMFPTGSWAVGAEVDARGSNRTGTP